MKVFNTFGFDPALTEDFNLDATLILPARNRGQILITNGKVTKGEEIIEEIKDNHEDTFLVSKPTYDYLRDIGIYNVTMFDPSKTLYSEDYEVVAQGGLILS